MPANFGRVFNVNDYVKVRLTEHGKKIYADQALELTADIQLGSPKFEGLPTVVKEDAEGYSEWQMWDLMEHFGEHMGMACKNCFDLDIRFDEGDLSDYRMKDAKPSRKLRKLNMEDWRKH